MDLQAQDRAHRIGAKHEVFFGGFSELIIL